METNRNEISACQFIAGPTQRVARQNVEHNHTCGQFRITNLSTCRILVRGGKQEHQEQTISKDRENT